MQQLKWHGMTTLSITELVRKGSSNPRQSGVSRVGSDLPDIPVTSGYMYIQTTILFRGSPRLVTGLQCSLGHGQFLHGKFIIPTHVY